MEGVNCRGSPFWRILRGGLVNGGRAVFYQKVGGEAILFTPHLYSRAEEQCALISRIFGFRPPRFEEYLI